VAQEGGSMIKPLGFGYPDDARAKNVDDAFLLGDSLLVCPVTQMGAREREIYLPDGLWYELASGKAVWGGEAYIASSPLDTIPVFVKAGTVLPLVKPCLSAREALAQTPELWVFPGADGQLRFYSDSGDGALDGATHTYFWNDDAGRLMDEAGAEISFKLFGGK
ncbi:MAG: alpha-glucosidase, partial [Clostridia bacterium]|nr:alpha-glucosidase [Clostridia bacterium]